MTPQHKLVVAGTCWCFAMTAFVAAFAMAVMPRPPEPIVPYCPTRNECWDAALSMARIAGEQAVATCTYSENEREWHRHIDQQNEALREDYDATCQGRIDDLYDAMASAELERGFEPWYPEDQLLCDCMMGLIAAPEITHGDQECQDAFHEICRTP